MSTSDAGAQVAASRFLALPADVRNLLYRAILVDTLVSNNFHRLLS
jgi:hypothetical protein